jgi:hypothetical protein
MAWLYWHPSNIKTKAGVNHKYNMLRHFIYHCTGNKKTYILGKSNMTTPKD